MLLVLVVGCARSLPYLDDRLAVAVGEPAFAATVEGVTSAVTTTGNRVDILLNGDEIFPAQLAAIAAAQTSITYAQYFYAPGLVSARIVNALAERCRGGVAVHVLLDGFGAAGLPDADATTLRRAGCELAFFRAAGSLLTGRANHRNHQRILVVDGRVGFTGGAGVSDRWLGDGLAPGRWRDTDVRVEGPVVRPLQSAFVETWQEATGVVLTGPRYFPASLPPAGTVRAQVVASAPAKGDYTLYTTLLLALRGARQSILITNPYFIPDDALTDSLVAAVARGVRVVLLVPGPIDWNIVRAASRAGFGPLLAAGVDIYEYTPALLHAKTMVVDGLWVTIGSANFDPRSLALNAELNLVLYDRGIARRMEDVFAADLRHARRVTYVRWNARPLWRRLLEWLARPFTDEL